MSKTPLIQLSILLCLYSLLFYFVSSHAIRLDYSCFYSGAKALLQGENPYQTLFATYLPSVPKVSLNVNPPIVLMLFIPFSMMNYSESLILWSVMSFILGLIAVSVTFSLAFKPVFLKRHRAALYLFYLAFYPTLINTAIGQLGSLVTFFIMLGYYFYIKKKDVLAAMMWGIIIGMKLFPGLLFFYALKQRRYKVIGIMFATVVVTILIPWLAYGGQIYTNYLSMLSHLAWYGDNWNASINGFLFRILTTAHSTQAHLLLVKFLYIGFFLGSLFWYLKKISSSTFSPENKHLTFSLTLVMMLLMSPYGWMYYFPLLILPLCLTWSEASAPITDKKWVFAWTTCLFFINFPIDYVRVKHMDTLLKKLTVHSFYFYGLCLLAYLLTQQMSRSQSKKGPSDSLTLPIQSLLAFGIVILSIAFTLRLTSTNFT